MQISFLTRRECLIEDTFSRVETAKNLKEASPKKIKRKVPTSEKQEGDLRAA